MSYMRSFAIVAVSALVCGVVLGDDPVLQEKLTISDIYQNAIQDAAVANRDEYFDLMAIPEDAERVTVLTWTSFPDSYVPGEDLEIFWGNVWVTLVPEVQTICREFETTNLHLRLQQLLGLPNVEDETRFFVEFEVDIADIFRPCTSPDIHTPNCPEEFADNGDSGFASFFAAQATSSYTPTGYPWTRLGYTYDWAPDNSELEYGASEYVVRQGSVVGVIDLYTSVDYCSSDSVTGSGSGTDEL